MHIQCNLDLVTLNLVTTCDLVTILQRPFFNLLREIIRFSDIIDLVAVYAETKSVTNLRLNCILKGKLVYSVIAGI